MNQQLKQIFTQKKFISLLLASTAVAGVLVLSGNQALKNYQSANELKSGVQTCFARVNQTLTALILNDFTSEYTKSDFTSTTQDCISDSIKFYEANLKSHSDIGKKLNALSTETYWFNEKANGIVGLAQKETVNVASSNIINKYETLEDYRNFISDKLDTVISASSNNIKYNLWAVIVIALSAISLAIWTLRRKNGQSKLQAEIEDEANSLLNQNEKSLIQIDKFLAKATNFWQAPNTYQVIKELESLLLVPNTNKVYVENINTQIADNNEHVLKVSNLTESFNITLNKLKDKAFSSGVIVDFDLADEVWVKGAKESVDQLLFSVCSEAIDKAVNQSENKKVTIRSKTLGGVVYFKISNANEKFEQDTIDYFSGTNQEPKDINVNLLMIKELIKDSDAQIKLSNKREKNLNFAQVEISFFAAKKPERRVYVRKGKRRDITASL